MEKIAQQIIDMAMSARQLNDAALSDPHPHAKAIDAILVQIIADARKLQPPALVPAGLTKINNYPPTN